MTAAGITPAVLDWVERTTPGARVARCTVRPLAGGNRGTLGREVTLRLTDGHGRLELVRKRASAHEIAGLRAAQAARPDATAIPELVACGRGWLITPLALGAPLAWGDPVPANVFDTLAVLHARYLGGAGLTRDVKAALDRIEQALGQLPA